MKPNETHQENKTEPHEKTPVEFLSPCSLKATSDPVMFNKNKMNNVENKGGDELELVSGDNAVIDEKQAKVITDIEDVENLDEETSQPWNVTESSSENGVPQIKKTFHKEKLRTGDGNVEILYQNSNNNNCVQEGFVSETKDYAHKVYGTEDTNWTRQRVGSGSDSEDEEDFPLRSAWKRVTYVFMLFMVGISCGILVLMKVFGGADWMNTATFSVIIMGSILLLPPGLYYGFIVICVICRRDGYTFWDVPQGPFD